MGLKFNPFSGNFDFAPGAGATVFEGEVAVYADLPQTVNAPPVGATFLVRESSGSWMLGTKKASGFYTRTNNTGVRADDWTYGGDFPVTSVNGQTGVVVLDAASVDASEVGHGHQSYEIQSYEVTVRVDGAGNENANGIYIRSGTYNGKSIFYKNKDTFIYWDNSNWFLAYNTDDIYLGTDATNPWDSTWSVSPGLGPAPAPILFRGNLNNFEQVIGARTATQLFAGTASTKDVGTGANDVAAGNHSHGNITTNGRIGTTSGLPIKTGSGGVLEAGSFGSSAGTFAAGDDARFTDSRNPLAHKASHASSGSDPLAPSDIGAQSVFVVEQLTITTAAQVNLTAARAKIFDIVQYAGQQVDVKLPSTNAQNADTFVFRWATGNDSIQIINSSSPAPIATVSSGQQVRVIRGTTDNWTVVPVDTHTHAASAITSGTLAHERGGLEADVSAYNGLVKISGGSTSAVTVTSAGEALLDDVDAAAQRTTLGLGNSATLNTGTTAGTVAAGDHTHTQLHDRSHAITSASDHTATANRIFYSDNTGAITELALGAANTVLTSNGTTSAPTFATVSGGVSAVDSTTADVFSVSGNNLVADDGGLINSANPAIVWNDASGKLVYQNPLERPSGAGSMFIGLAPSTTALGTDAINLQNVRGSATTVASGTSSVAIGSATASGIGSVSIGPSASGATTVASGLASIAIGSGTGGFCRAQGQGAIAIGGSKPGGGGSETLADGISCTNINGYNISATNSTAIGVAAYTTLRGQFTFGGLTARGGVYVNDGATLLQWRGSTTNDTQTEIFLDGASNTRAVVAANRMWVGELYIAAMQSTSAKAIFLHRTFAIKRDGSNNTALVGSVQTVGADQNTGSPTWSVSIDADDSTESLRIRVTGAASETVYWTASAWINEVG